MSNHDGCIICQTNDGRKFRIQYKNIRPTIFCLSLHKAGSCLMFDIISDISSLGELPSCDLYSQLWTNSIGENDLTITTLDAFNQIGIVYYGIRDIGHLRLIPNFWTARKLVLIRDPRDIAVSYYFSMMRSHSLPPSQHDRKAMSSTRDRCQHMSVSDYVISGEADSPIRNMESYIALLDGGTRCSFYKYEDVIFEKRKWVATLAANLNASLPEATLKDIADKYDVIPNDCDPGRHIRQVTRGDYKNHLNKSAINYIQTKFLKVFDAFDYGLA